MPVTDVRRSLPPFLDPAGTLIKSTTDFALYGDLETPSLDSFIAEAYASTAKSSTWDCLASLNRIGAGRPIQVGLDCFRTVLQFPQYFYPQTDLYTLPSEYFPRWNTVATESLAILLRSWADHLYECPEEIEPRLLNETYQRYALGLQLFAGRRLLSATPALANVIQNWAQLNKSGILPEPSRLLVRPVRSILVISSGLQSLSN